MVHKGINGIIDKLKQRVDEYYHPLNNVIKSNRPSNDKKEAFIKNHMRNNINHRNKYNRLNEVRQRHKQEELELKRSKMNEINNKKELEQRYHQDLQELEVDLDQLIEEEKDLEQLNENRDEEVDAYERELEEYLSQLTIS